MDFIFRNKKKIFFILVILFLFLMLTAKKDDKTNTENNSNDTTDKNPVVQTHPDVKPLAKGGRRIGMSITEGGIGFDKAFASAKSVGVSAIELPIPWDDYEPSPKEYTPSWLPVADQFYSKNGIKLSLSLNPIDTNNLRLPKDLKDKAFNDPTVIERYKAFVDFVASSVPNSNILFVSVGNEVDIYLGNSDKKWDEYIAFYNAVAPYVKSKFPKAVIGSKMSFEGITNHADKAKQIENNADVVLVTYYPFKLNSFIVRDPSTVNTDFKTMVDLYPNKKIYFAEIGYPSGKDNDSSEEKQAQFISETFYAWDKYQSQIPFLNFVWLHDKSASEVSGFQKYYGLKDKTFASYLGSLGLRTYDGKDKQAFVTLKKESSERGW